MEKDFEAIGRGQFDVNLGSVASRVRRSADTHAVVLGRTYANLRKFNSATNKEAYSFAPSGEETAWNIIATAVRNAKKFIYIEDQYFVSRRLKAELLKKLKDDKFQFLLILMQDSSAFEKSPDILKNEFPYLIAARNEIRADFLSADPKRRKWRMFSLKGSLDAKRQEFCGSYVHSKTLIFDDEFAVVGTANADDRGYTYDTEIVAGVTDDPFGRASSQRFARDLRVNLWHKHLAVPQTSLVDFTKSLPFWFKPSPLAMTFDSSELEDSPMLGVKPVLRNTNQPNRLWQEAIDPDADLLPLP